VLGQKVQSIFKNGQKSIIEENQDSKEKVKIQDTELLVGNNEEVPVNVSKGILRDRKGKVEGYVLVASDISSEREAQKKIKQSLREKEVLLAEIHHRVKNNLAVISGLLQMQIWEAENEHAASALRESQFRVRSIALVHEKLYQSENLSYIKFDQYIRDLLQAVSSTYIGEDSNIEIKTELEGVILNINQAIPCSLLLNELIVNAFKHAFDDQGGLITVSMRATGQKVTLQVKDNGKGFPKAQIERESLGMSLIDTLSKQLNGTLEFQNDNGADIKIIFEAEKIIND
jgi:two-component sensor histidine kinase